MLRAVALTLTCAVLALTPAACRQSGSGGDADPATLVPAGAPVYAQATVRPAGELRDGALAAAGKLLRTDDPAAKLRELVDEELAEDGLTWERDFAPWLGEQAGIWATSLEGEDASFAAILATTDTEAAAAAIQRFKQPGGAAYTKRSHADVDYEVNSDGIAGGLVDDFLVIGTEEAFKRSAELAGGDDALADSDRYEDAIGDLEDDRLGQYYVDTKALLDAVVKSDPASAAGYEQIKGVVPFDELGPMAGSFQADGDGMAIDSVMTDLPEGPLRTLSTLFAGSELMRELPGDAWGAFALPKLGEGSKALFTSVAGALGGAAAAAQIRQSTGLDIEQDVFSWVGDAGVFIRGASEPALDGALVIQSTDDGRASAAFGKIIGLIGKEAGVQPEPIRLEGAESAFSLPVPDAGKPLVLARGAGRVVAAYGEEAAKAALDPATKLGDSALYDDAREALGDGTEPASLVSMPAVLELVDALGAADADYDEARPYLETIAALVSGGTLDGDALKSRIAVTLK